MKHADAVAFLRPTLGPDPGTSWADLGAGRGTFTRALAELLGSGARVVALDHDPAAVRALEKLAEEPPSGARIVPVRGDLRRPGAVDELGDVELDGVLLANVLHFFSEPAGPLSDAAALLGSHGRIVVVEYEGRSANPWIPYPLPPDRLAAAAVRAGLPQPRISRRMDSAYRGTLYCAALHRSRG